jgi:hypothetical protein
VSPVSLPSPAPNVALEATGHSVGFFLSSWVGGAVARASAWAFGATGAGKNQKSLPRVECTIPLPCNAGYEIVPVSVVGTLFVRWSSGMDDEERIWSSGKIVRP